MAQQSDDQHDHDNPEDLSPKRLKRRAFLSGLAVGAATVGVAATGAATTPQCGWPGVWAGAPAGSAETAGAHAATPCAPGHAR